MNFDLSADQRMWQKVVHDFVAREVKPHAKRVDETAAFNTEAVRKMVPLGLLGLNIEEEYGGAEVGALGAAIAIEEIGWGCGSTALALEAHNHLGCEAVTLFGTHEQKERFLAPIANGEGQLAALALTEPEAGSDLSGNVRCQAKREGDQWLINGQKMWCTNASLANFIVTLVRTAPPEAKHSLSLLIVPTNTPGLDIGPPEKKMGLKGSPTHAVSFRDVRVPLENLLGAEGHGLSQALSVLDGGRIGIGAMSVGLAQAAFEESLRYARERHAFGKPIADQQAIQWMLADAATQIHAARLMVYQAAWLKDQGRSFTQQAGMAKLFASEMCERVCRNAIQIHGGYGYSAEYPVERIYRDARLLTIGEGTSEINRLVIARHVLKNY